MPSIVTCAVKMNDVMCGSHNMHVPASQPSLGNYHAPKFTYTPAVCASQTTSTKNNHFTFLSLSHENTDKNMMNRIFNAVSKENKADFNENFSTYLQEPIGPLYKW